MKKYIGRFTEEKKPASMKVTIRAASILAFFGMTAVATNASAIIYNCKYPPVSASAEINGSMGANSARTLVASGLMGAKFYGNVNVSGIEWNLLNACKYYTPAGSTWPEGCNFVGMAQAINVMFAQGWGAHSYDSTQQGAAINTQIHGIKTYQSPVLVPLYGHADHWATIYQMEVDTITGNLIKVRYIDAGIGDQEDGSGDLYMDGLRSSSGATWKNIFYQVLSTVGTSDPYYQKFVLSYDPPVGSSLTEIEREAQAHPHGLASAPGLVDNPADMNPMVAQQGALEALWLSGEYDDPQIRPVLEQGTPGPAWEVHGFTPSGEPWNYYLVPILIGNGKLMSAMVQLSAEDGSVEQFWMPRRPVRFDGLSLEQARAEAKKSLLPGETLWGGELTWDPRDEDRAYGSTMTPYYEFHVTGKSRDYRGGLMVGLEDGAVRGKKSFETNTTGGRR